MSHAQDAAIQLAETIQTAHIKKRPSAKHDLAPATAADKKETVELDQDADIDDLSDVAEDEIPLSVLRSSNRRPQMPPLPDLRFEQSYLASIKDANDWRFVTYITVRDQVFMPLDGFFADLGLVQGIAWSLVVAGWRHWNLRAKFSGHSVGARVRRWWWGVNNWKIPNDGTLGDRELAEGAAEYFKTEASSGSG